MTEYFHRMTAPNGDTWLTIVTEVRDPENLREPFVQSTHFKRLPDGAPFRSEPCSARRGQQPVVKVRRRTETIEAPRGQGATTENTACM